MNTAETPQLTIPRVNRSLSDKIEWIVNYMKENEPHVDIMNAAFVDAYIEEFNPRHAIMIYGANKCKEISRVLKSGYDMEIFRRGRIGLNAHLTGFPNWVYVYSLNCD